MTAVAKARVEVEVAVQNYREQPRVGARLTILNAALDALVAAAKAEERERCVEAADGAMDVDAAVARIRALR